ncbi:hypothetical protein pb186bvf_016047 [Paramecium bursaria]
MQQVNRQQEDRPWWKFWGNSQKQLQIQSDGQVLMELQFIVQKDLENFIGVLVETCAVFELVTDESDPLRRIHLNRLIAQLNLSRSIYYDTQQTSESNKTSSNLQQYKNKARIILKQYTKQVSISDDQIEQLLKEYDQLLEKKLENLTIKATIPSSNNKQSSPQQRLFDNLFTSISQVDQELEKLRRGQYKQKDDFSVESQRLNERYATATIKIQAYLKERS